MSILKKNIARRKRRTLRVRSKVGKVSTFPRVSVFRSLRHLYAQVIDDAAHKTLVSASTAQLADAKGNKAERAKAVGLALAAKAREHGIERVRFDRGRSLYHGRVKAFADGLREGGLTV